MLLMMMVSPNLIHALYNVLKWRIKFIAYDIHCNLFQMILNTSGEKSQQVLQQLSQSHTDWHCVTWTGTESKLRTY